MLKDEKQLQLVLDAFFEALNQLDGQYAGVNRSFVYSNNGIAPMIRTMARVVKYENNHNREANLRKRDLLIETFSNFYRSSYTYYHSLGETQLRQRRKERVGNAGSNTEEEIITTRIRDRYANDFPYRRGKANPAWESEVTKFISSMDAINRKMVDGAGSWVFREFHAEETKKKLLKPIDSREAFGTVLKVLYQDLIEGSGKDKTENRLAKLLGLPQIYDLEPIRKLNTLRTCWEHKPGQVDPTKRQLGLQAISELSGSPGVTGFHDMTPEQYQKTAIALLKKIADEVRNPALEVSTIP